MKLGKAFILTLFLGIISIVCEAQIAPNSGIVAYYPFNGDLKDISEYAAHPKVHGPTLVEDRNGNFNSAIYFDGLDDYMRVPAHIDLPERSIVVWVSAFQISSSPSIIIELDHPSLAHGNFKIEVFNDSVNNKIRFTNGLNEFEYSGFQSATWYMCTFTMDADTSKFYLNDSLVFQSEKSLIVDTTGLYFPVIGMAKTTKNYFEGKMDEFRVYNRPLSHCEIAYLFNQYDKPDFKDQSILVCDSSSISLLPPEGFLNYKWVFQDQNFQVDTLRLDSIPVGANEAQLSFENEYGCVFTITHNLQRLSANSFFDFEDTIICSGESIMFNKPLHAGFSLSISPMINLEVEQTHFEFAYDNEDSITSLFKYNYLVKGLEELCEVKGSVSIAVLPKIKNPLPEMSGELCPEDDLMIQLKHFNDSCSYKWENENNWLYNSNGGFDLLFKNEENNPVIFKDQLLVANLDGCTGLFDFELSLEPLLKVNVEGDLFLCPEWSDKEYSLISEYGKANIFEVNGGRLMAFADQSFKITWEYPRFDPWISIEVESPKSCASEKIVFPIKEKKPNECPEYSSKLNVPNIITPNGDGFNDLLKITKTTSQINLSIKIYSRNGKLIYQSKNYENNWGEGVASGDYYYEVTQSTYDGDQTFKGSIKVLN